MRKLLAIAVAFHCLLAALPAGAAPLADKLPSETVVYLGWAGRGLVFDGSMLGQMLKEPQVGQMVAVVKGLLQQHPALAGSAGQAERLASLAEIAWQRPMALGLVDLLQRDVPSAPSVALLIDLGDKRDLFAAQLDEAIAAAAEQLQIAEATAGTTTYKTVTTRGGLQVSFGYVETRFFACLGTELPARLIDVASGGSLGASERFAASVGSVSGDDEQLVFYADIEAALGLAARLAPAPAMESQPAGSTGEPQSAVGAMAEALGLTRATAVVGVVRIVERGLHTKIRLFAPAPHTGVLLPLAGAALGQEALAGVPGDALFMAAARVSPQAALRELRAVAGRIAPGVGAQMDEVIGGFDERFGVSLEADILGALGDTWVLSSAASQGGLLTGTLLTVAVKDADKLAAAIAKIEAPFRGPGPPSTTAPAGATAATSPSEDEGPRVLVTDLGRTEIHYLSAGRAGSPSPVLPAWALHKDRLYLALWPQVIQSAIENAGVTELTKNGEYQRIRSKVCADASVILYADDPQILRQVYPLYLLAGSLLRERLREQTGAGSAPLWPMALSRLRKYAWPHITAVCADPQGITVESYGSGASLAVPMMNLSVLVPSLRSARSAARAAASTANLHGIGMSLALYRAMYDDMPPPDLAALIREKLIDSTKILVSPASGREPPKYEDGKLIGEVDYTYIPLPADAPSEMIMVYERPENYGSKHTNVLYASGRVERVDIGTFRAQLARTRDWVEDNPVTTTRPVESGGF